MNLFNTVKTSAPNSNVFDLTHDVKMSMRMGELVPILNLECVPGDTFNLSAESLVRFAPLISPVMHRLDVTMHFFFVPNRILWKHWDEFITNDPSAPALPFITYGRTTYGSFPLLDYMGLPDPGATNTYDINCLPFAAYQKVYDEYYRDQNNIVSEWPEDGLTDGSNAAIMNELLEMRKRAWEHDYFTSALPSAQKGSAVDLPLGSVTLDPAWTAGTPNPRFEQVGGTPATAGNLQASSGPGTESVVSSAATGTPLAYDPDGTLQVEPTTINDLRRAFRLQEFLEKMIRGGSRVVEVIKNFFGVTSPDARLQRPEYITGTKSPVVISEVLNTSDTTDAPQGNMAGHAVSVTAGQYGHYKCLEHGYIIGIMSVLPKTAYYQGIPKHFLKNDLYDFFWPQFANIGEQEIVIEELYSAAATPGEIFGYIPRYAEYKYMSSRVAGDFKTTLDFWHMARKFATQPALNAAFIEADPTERVFAVEDPAEDKLYCHVLNKIKAVRPMPKYGTPTF